MSGAIEIVEYGHFREFGDAVFDLLLQRETENCWQIATIQLSIQNGYAPDGPQDLPRPLLLGVRSAGNVELAAMQTRRDPLMVSRGSPQVMHCLADELARRNWAGKSI